MTMRYVHLTTARKERAVALLSNAGREAEGNGARMAPGGEPTPPNRETPDNLDDCRGRTGAGKGT